MTRRRTNSTRFAPPHFPGVKLLSLPSRVVKAQRLAETKHGILMVLGSRGQVYVRGSFSERLVSPGPYGLRYAEGLLLLGVINAFDFNVYSKRCDAASAQRDLRRAASELEDAADRLGINLTEAQKKILAKVSS